jgi:hypothetical protein
MMFTYIAREYGAMGQVIYGVLRWFLMACKTFLYNVLIDPRGGDPLALNQRSE